MKQGSCEAALAFCRRTDPPAKRLHSFLPPCFLRASCCLLYCGTLTAAIAVKEHRVNSSSFPPGMPAPRKARHGCVVQVLAALVLGVVVLLGVMAIVAPWGFYMGGHFHIIPQWTGWGRIAFQPCRRLRPACDFFSQDRQRTGTDAYFRQWLALHPARRTIQVETWRRLSKSSRDRSPGQDSASLYEQLHRAIQQHGPVA